MPHIPAILSGLAHKLGKKATVTELTQLSPGLLKVVLATSGTWHPGSSAEFLVSKQELRHYTLLGDGTVYVQLHSGGPGTAWAKQLSIGDEVLMFGPGGRPWIRASEGGRRKVMLGDASALGLFRALIDALGASAKIVGAIEVAVEDADAVKALIPELDVIELGEPGEALLDWTRRFAFEVEAGYLAGHAQSIVELRKELVSGTPQRKPLSRKAVVAQGYWATGKVGL